MISGYTPLIINTIFNSLMKISAFILLTCYLSYLTETIKIPLSFSVVCKKTISCSDMGKGHCMKKNKTGKSKKGGSEDCNRYCANCPFNTVTILYLNNSSCLRLVYRKEYAQVRSSVLPGFTNDAWKPPDIILA